MPPIPITDADIQAHTTGGSYERGREYLEDGAVLSLTQTNEQTLKAKVQGTDVHPYIVQIRFDGDEVSKVECTCPYHGGSWCKHIVAALLKAITADNIPQSEPATVAGMVNDLDRDELVRVLQRLVAHDPDLLDQIERERARLTGEGDN